MRDLSLKGVARRYGGITGELSVRDIFTSSINESISVRSELESMARKQHSFGVSECIYGWTARFEQTWTHIVVRIRLKPDAGITDATMDGLRDTWEDGIETAWSDEWGCGRSGELSCPLTFEVQWVTANQHHTVRVRPGPDRANMTTWHTTDGGGVAAHESGHMLGHPDEYTDPECPDRDPVNTGTIMHMTTGNIPERLVTRFANNIGSSVVGI